MDGKQQTNQALQQDERFIAVLTEMISLKDKYAVPKLAFYKTRGRRSMVFFRMTGILVILLSVSIPFLTTFDTNAKPVVLPFFVVPIVALLIAALTGLTSFFRWESSWKDFAQTEYALEHALWTWELSIAEARYEGDVQQAIKIAIEATRQLLDQAHVATITVGEEFFKRVQASQTHHS